MNECHAVNCWFSSLAKELLRALAAQLLQLVMDNSLIGPGCIAPMLSVGYHGRALPLCWPACAVPKAIFPNSS